MGDRVSRSDIYNHCENLKGAKGNESISSIIDLTFYHKGIYDLKRYFFVSTVELEAGNYNGDNYIVPLRLNIAEFVDYLNKVLSYYYGSTYKVLYLNPDYKYDEKPIERILTSTTRRYGMYIQDIRVVWSRWVWDTQDDNANITIIKIGYPSIEVSHIFEYGFEGGLLKLSVKYKMPR